MAININYRKARLARRASSLVEAIGWAKWLIQNGYNVDMGLMQVNSQHLQRLNLTVENVFDPCTNIRIGSMILTQNYLKARDQYGHGQNALYASLSAYNTGNFRRGFNNGYVSRVVKNAGKSVEIQPTEAIMQSPPILVSSGVTANSSSVQRSYISTASSVQQKHVHAKRSRQHYRSNAQTALKTKKTPTSSIPYSVSPYDAPTGISMN
jgi:hypothetical protein